MNSDNDIAHIGHRHIWGGTQPVGIRHADRRHHMYMIGKTGAGKSTLLRNLILQDIEAGRGVGVIDPHGDLAVDLLDHIPSRRTDDVVYFDPADAEYPIGFNLLRSVTPHTRHLVASSVVSAFKSIWHDSWGPRLEYILFAAVAALLDVENSSILGLQRILNDKRYRTWVVKQIRDPVIRSFWIDEFEQYDERFMREAIAPIQNKVGQLLMAPPIRNILGQVRSKIDPAFMMDNGRIFIANLSKGRIGEDKSNLLGAVLTNQFQIAAMARSDYAEDERRPFHLFIDEFQNFSSDSFASILSESRKYGLCLALSHQYIAQLRDEIRNAIFGNVGTIIAFRVGESDSRILEREFGNTYSAQHFTELPNFEVCVRLLENGELRDPFLARTDPPYMPNHRRSHVILKQSRQKYSTPKEAVEDKIHRWMGKRF